MFRDLYKKANDEIKGDRAILDKAFLQAAQPEKKKSPAVKYSFIGTVVAAVILLGAVFANPSVFTNRSEDIGTLEEPTQAMATLDAVTANAENKEIAIASVLEADEVVEDEVPAEETATNKPAVKEKVSKVQPKTPEKVKQGGGGSEDSAIAQEEAPDGEADYSVMVMSLEGEDDEAYENPTEEAVIGFSLRDRQPVEEAATEEATEEVTEELTEDVTESAAEVEVFSYMYDLSVWDEYSIVKEGFENTDVSPVTNREEAVERAERELNEYIVKSVSYDPVEKMWRVEFQKCGPDGYDYIYAYLNSDGITQMIVYPGYNFGE